MKESVVSEVQIVPIRPKGGQVAFASCVYNHSLSLNNLAVYARADGSGFRVVYPSQVLPNGRRINTVYPICRKVGYAIEAAVTAEMERINRKLGKNMEEQKSGPTNHYVSYH